MVKNPVEGVRRIGKDVRWALRMLSRHRRFAVVAALPLILGVGVNTAVFTIFNAAVLRPLPVPEPDRVVRLYEDAPNAPRRKMFSYREYVDDRERTRAFTDLAAYAEAGLLMRAQEADGDKTNDIVSQAVNGAFVSGNYYRLLGGTLAIGRWLTENAHDDDVNSAVISYRLWTRRFSAAPGILGQLVQLNGVPVAIVGVTAPGFVGAEPRTPDVFLSLRAAALIDRQAEWRTNDASPGLRMIGRLRPDVTSKQAEAMMTVIAQQRASVSDRGHWSLVRIAAIRASFLTMEPEILAGTSVILFVTGLVLLTSCANVATLLLVRASVRGKEIAIRLAIGASRWDLVRMLLTESLLVAFASSVMALLLSTWTVKVLMTSVLDAQSLPDSLNMMPDLRVLAYTTLVAVFTAVVCGLAPALRASRRDLVPALNDDGAATGRAGNSRWINVLVTTQLAVSFMLLAACGLLIRSEWQGEHADVGLETQRTAEVYVDLAANGFDETRARDAVMQIRDHVRHAPGVADVTVAARPPLSNSLVAQVSSDGSARPVLAGYNLVDADFFATLRIPILRGHNFGAQVAGGVPEAVISESLANTLWPGEDPLGRRLNLGLATSPTVPAHGASQLTVVVGGVARDTQRATLLLDATARYLYLPLTAGWGPLQAAVVIRTEGPADAAISILKAETQALNIATSIAPRRLADVLQERRRPVAIAATLAAVLGVLALCIAVIGEYGLVSYGVRQRTREIGVRIALGAQAGDVIRLVVRQGAWAVGAGVVVGYIMSVVAGLALAKFLFQVSPFDVLTYVAVGTLFVTTGAIAIAVPTYKAATIDPVVALRQRT